MEKNQEPRNKPKYICSIYLTRETIILKGDEIVSSKTGARIFGYSYVKERN